MSNHKNNMHVLEERFYSNPDIKKVEMGEPMPTTDHAVKLTGAAPREIIKTLLLKSNKDQYYAVILCAPDRLDQNKLRKLVKAKKLRFVRSEEVMELTGYEAGGVPPLGLPSEFQLLLDENVLEQSRVFGGGGKQELLMELNPHLIETLAKPEINNYKLEEPEQ